MSLLRIGGLVSTPQQLDFAGLGRLDEQHRETSTLLGGREIVAVSLAQLLALAQASARGRSIVAESADGDFLTTLPIAAAAACVIVYRVGDAPLPRSLGGPYRLVTNGRVRCGDVKHLGAIYVSDDPVVDGTESERVCLRSRSRAA